MALLEQHADEVLLTTNHVRGETWTLINRREGHRQAIAFLDVLARSPRVRVQHVERDLEDEALLWLRRRDDREFSFVDATSFVMMRRRAIGSALAFDGDFAAAGFVELR